MTPLLHPFDDPVFAAVATARGLTRDDLPDEYDPDHTFRNDHEAEDVPGLPAFEFLVGDEHHPGAMNVRLGAGVRYSAGGGVGGRHILHLPFAAPETVRTACVGRPLGDVAQVPGHEAFTIASVDRNGSDAAATVLRLAPVEGPG